MGRDTKPFINNGTPVAALPFPRRASIAASFSLPTLSLSSRSKPTPPPLAPVDTFRASNHPLDDESASSSYIKPNSSHPFPMISAGPQTRPTSPLRPPNSPGSSVPLPSIRSLRSRFSFSTPSQEQPNTPSRTGPPTTQKRVVSRRFLPFGNSNSTTTTSNSTPTVPRKSLGDVFALGRSSTSSRLDTASTRSGTPSGQSARSVTSAATLRGWTSSKQLEPGLGSRLSFGRPRSHDYSLDADLGYVVAIESRDETIRQKHSLPTASSSPLISGTILAAVEASEDGVPRKVLCGNADHITPPKPVQRIVTDPLSIQVNPSVSDPNEVVELAGKPRPSPRQSTLCPIIIPASSTKGPFQKCQMEHIGSTEQILVEGPEPRDDVTPDAFLFTPIDDRSDITSSAYNTPSSISNSDVREPYPIPPFRSSPSPSPTSVRTNAGAPNERRLDGNSAEKLWSDSSSSTTPSQQLEIKGKQIEIEGIPLRSPRREYAMVGLLEESNKSLVALRRSQSSARSRSVAMDTEGRATFATEVPNPTAAIDPTIPSFATTPSPCPIAPFNEPTWSFNDSERSATGQNIRLGPVSLSSSRLSSKPEAFLDDSVHAKNRDQSEEQLHSLDRDLLKLLSPHRVSSSYTACSAPPSTFAPVIALPSTSPSLVSPPLPSGLWTPQQNSRGSGSGSLAHYPPATPSPSTASFRHHDLQPPAQTQRSTTPAGTPNGGRSYSSSGQAILSNKMFALVLPHGDDLKDTSDKSSPTSTHFRPFPHRSPSVNHSMTRKRSASFDLSGSTTFMRDSSDPFRDSQLGGPRRTDWLGPRTAKAFAAAGLLDHSKDNDRTTHFSSTKSDVHRGAPWRVQHSERSGGLGSVRSHSRLGSEITSPSSRTRSLVGGDSSPSFGRRSLDYTAPPSPVSTHRTLVSNGTSSSQSQHSIIQGMRERHDLETEALLLALAGSKKSERDLRAENEDLMGYVSELERRIATLESERDQAHGKWGNRERARAAPVSSDIDLLDRRRIDILAGRPSSRGWSSHTRVNSVSSNRSPSYPSSRALPSPRLTHRSASATPNFRTEFEIKTRVPTPPTRRTDWADDPPSSVATIPSAPRTSTPPTPRTVTSGITSQDADYDEWHEDSFAPSMESQVLLDHPARLSSTSMASLLPQMPGNMSLLIQETGPLPEEDEYSFRSASPSSLTLVHPRNSTPKPCAPSNISPITAEFSFNSIPGSPRSLRLRPEEEMHLADLISLQGLDFADVTNETDG